MVSRGRILHSGAGRIRTAIAVCSFTALLAACEKEPVAEEPLLRPVRYTAIATSDNAELRTYSGTARAELEMDMSFRVGGTLTSRSVDVGSQVNRSDLLGALDSTDFQVRLDEARAGLARAEAEKRNADAAYQRTRDLYESQNASRTQLDSARAMSESAQAQYRAAAQQVEAARLQMSYTRLSAPQQCTVAQTFVAINQNVSAGQPIVQLNCGQCAEVVVSVPDTDIAKINEGMSVTARISALTDDQLPGVIHEVGVATGARGSTYPVTVALKEPCENVRSGMAVDVTFSFPSSGKVGDFVVPYVAVGEDRSGNFVFVLEPDEEGRLFANRRSVEVGNASANGIVVRSGLSAGELIATAGVRRLTSGQEVTLLGSAETTTR